MTIMTVLIVSGCNTETEKKHKLRVCASFFAVYDIARQIGGDRIEIKNLVPEGVEPHDWEPSVKAMISIENSDVFVYNGLGIEGFAEKIRESQGSELIFVEASEGCKILYGYEDHDDEHDHDKHDKEEGDISDADPHVWLDPDNAAKEAENICAAFCRADPENAEYYNENLENFRKKASDLNNAYKNALGDLENKELIVSHRAYGYICSAYGLTQEAVEGMGSGGDPSPRRIREIYDNIRKNNIDCIFYESLTGSRIAETISEDMGIDMYPITAFEGRNAEQRKQDFDYFDAMYMNLESLEKGLGDADDIGS